MVGVRAGGQTKNESEKDNMVGLTPGRTVWYCGIQSRGWVAEASGKGERPLLKSELAAHGITGGHPQHLAVGALVAALEVGVEASQEALLGKEAARHACIEAASGSSEGGSGECEALARAGHPWQYRSTPLCPPTPQTTHPTVMCRKPPCGVGCG